METLLFLDADYQLVVCEKWPIVYGWINADGTWEEFIEHEDGRIERFLRVNGVVYENNVETASE